jgi:FkbM family methyltransferase
VRQQPITSGRRPHLQEKKNSVGIKGALAKAVNKIVRPLGIEIVKADGASMPAALKRLNRNAIPVATIIDVGASDGKWLLMARAHFPSAKLLMIEALKEHQPALENIKRRDPQSDYVISACGAGPGEVTFNVAADLDGSGISQEPTNGGRRVPVTSIDHLVREKKLPGPFLIKLDTHGYELPIIEGASETLKHTNVLIVEAYNFKLCPECLRFHELCARLEELGFRCLDLADPLNRKHDGLFWQADLFFGRKDLKLFDYPHYA